MPTSNPSATSRRLAVIVSRPWFRPGRSWNSYVRYFIDLNGRSAEEHFYDWWHGLPDDSFTKTGATVRTFWCEETSLIADHTPTWLRQDSGPSQRS